VTRDGVVYRSDADQRLLVLFAGSHAAGRPHTLRARVPDGGAFHAVDWSRETATRGSYLIFGPGDLLGWGTRLAEPHGRVHFAGSETSPLPSYMDGAVVAGERAAREILEAG
jgi:monoamine oxidase